MNDKVIDRYGNKECSKCGTRYGKACWNCCEHEVELEDNYDRGIIIVCNKCFKEFTIDEFNNDFIVTRRS